MPMFYFDVIEINGALRHDNVGVNCVDVAAAKAEAKSTLSTMAMEAVDKDLSELRIQVRDETGHTVSMRIVHFDTVEDED